MPNYIHTVDLVGGSKPLVNPGYVKYYSVDVPVQAGGAAVASLGSITAGTGFDTLPVIAPTGGTLTAGVTPANPAIVRATSIKAVGTPTVVTPGTGIAINDTFNLVGGVLASAGAAGNTLAAAGVPAKVTVTHAQLVGVGVNAGGTGYVVNDTITLAGGTAGTAAVVTVKTVAAGVVNAVTITTAGDYTVEATTFTQASTSGAGTGATFNAGVFGAKTLSLTTAGGYTTAPVLAGAATTNVVGTGSGLVVASTYGLGTAVIDESGNYSGAPSWTVTAADGNGTGASIASGTLGSSGNPVFVHIPLGHSPINSAVMAMGNMALDAVCELQSLVGTTNANGTVPYISIAVQPRLAANTLTAGVLNVAVLS